MLGVKGTVTAAGSHRDRVFVVVISGCLPSFHWRITVSELKES